jgi:S1-C subfamily serine protease
MLKYAAFVMLFFCLLVSCSCGSQPAAVGDASVVPVSVVQAGFTRKDNKQLMEHISKRTVYVKRDCAPKKGTVVITNSNPYTVFDGGGSGTIIRSKENRSYILTAQHVAVMPRKYQEGFDCKLYVKRSTETYRKGRKIVATLVTSHRGRDIAWLSVDENLDVSTAFELDPFLGEDVWAAGFPHQFAAPRMAALSVTKGTIATKSVPVRGNASSNGYYYRVTSQIFFGNSGGGIWNREGKLLAVAVALYGWKPPDSPNIPYEGYYYVKPVAEASALLKARNKYLEVMGE